MVVKSVVALAAASVPLISAYLAVQGASDTDSKNELRSYYGQASKTFTIKLQLVHRRNGHIDANASP